MLIISFVNTKGGAGKTTMTLVSAFTAHDAGYKICVIDIDNNKDFSRWVKYREKVGMPAPFPTFTIDRNQHNVTDALEDILYSDDTDQYDIVFIDTPGHMTSDVNYPLIISDLVIFPIKDDENEVFHGMRMADSIGKLAEYNETVIDCAFAFTAVTDIAHSRTLRLNAENLEKNGYSIIPASLKNRNTYKLIKSWGLTLREIADGMEVENFQILDPKRTKTSKEKSSSKSLKLSAKKAIIAANEFGEGLFKYAFDLQASHNTTLSETSPPFAEADPINALNA